MTRSQSRLPPRPEALLIAPSPDPLDDWLFSGSNSRTPKKSLRQGRTVRAARKNRGTAPFARNRRRRASGRRDARAVHRPAALWGNSWEHPAPARYMIDMGWLAADGFSASLILARADLSEGPSVLPLPNALKGWFRRGYALCQRLLRAGSAPRSAPSRSVRCTKSSQFGARLASPALDLPPWGVETALPGNITPLFYCHRPVTASVTGAEPPNH